MKKIVLFVLLILFWVVILFPKVLLWNYFVIEMHKKDISIEAKEVDIKLWLAYNKIHIQDAMLLKSFKVDTFDVTYSILDPLHVEFVGGSEYGDFRGQVALLDKNGSVIFEKSDLKKAMFRSYFKKSKDGMKYEFAY